MPDDHQERTERGTQKRRDDARKKGKSPRSREITTAAIMLASALFLVFSSEFLIARLKEIMILFWSGTIATPMTSETFSQVMNSAVMASLTIIGPTMLFFGLVGVISMIGQSGLVLTEAPLSPDWSRVNPLTGFKRIVSFQSSAELLKGIVKLAIVAWVSYRLIQKDIPTIIEAVDSDPDRLLMMTVTFATRIILWVGIAMAFLGAVDYLFQIWNFERSIRMTRQEIKEEGKQTDGNPLIRSRIRNIQRALTKKRMMTDVPKADVIITNPTHLAVALKYRSETMAAPIVVAKGAGLIAEKIREIARKNQIPILENKPLARSLFSGVEIGSPIPSDLYKAVAEILAYVYKLRGKSIK
ncbi:MAG: flagellar biosynthesis protein FlhB [Nitrospiria bacterium]